MNSKIYGLVLLLLATIPSVADTIAPTITPATVKAGTRDANVRPATNDPMSSRQGRRLAGNRASCFMERHAWQTNRTINVDH
jgi:hypothetical protein